MVDDAIPMKESKLYPFVEKWLRKYPNQCFKTAINKGLKYSRIDVVGVKDVGGHLSGEIETISVEVKRGSEPFATASGQALGYNVYANRVYLADNRNDPFSSDEINIASHLGVGLIHIQNGVCKEVLSSPYYKPITRLNLLLLEKSLLLGKCQMCGSFFDICCAENRFSKVSRENLKKAISDDKGLVFWNRDVADRKEKTGIDKYEKGDETTYERRFICRDCIHYFISQLKDEK